MRSASQGRFVLVSVGTEENAVQISRTLLEENLAACVSRIPHVTSLYFWQGKLEESSEILLIIKTQATHVEKVEEVVKRVHTYDVPEIVTLDWKEASKPYFNWLLAETSLKKGSRSL